MQRDMDLVREILLAFEASPTKVGMPASLKGPAWKGRREERKYHLCLLFDAGLLTDDASLKAPKIFVEPRLTMAGHDFIKSLQDPKFLGWVKKITGEQVSNVATSLLADLAGKFIMQKIGMES